MHSRTGPRNTKPSALIALERYACESLILEDEKLGRWFIAFCIRGKSDIPVDEDTLLMLASVNILSRTVTGWHLGPAGSRFAANLGILSPASANREISSQSFERELFSKLLIPTRAPEISGFKIAGMVRSRAHIGGDFIDYMPMRHGRYGIVVGDAMGHGPAAALVATTIRAWLRSLVLTHSEVGEIVSEASRGLEEIDGVYGTLSILRLEPEKKSIVFAGAGQPGYVVSSSGQTRVLNATSLPLGFPDDSSDCSNVAVEDGDLIILLTDGILEAQGAEGPFFGIERTMATAFQHRNESPESIVEAIFAATLGFSQSQEDDMAIVVVKVVRTN